MNSMLQSVARRAYHGLVPNEREREVLWQLRARKVMGWAGALRHHARWKLGTPDRVMARLLGEHGLQDARWCFILGVNNSGTTLLERVLRSHTDIRGLPTEGQFLTAALPRGTDLGANRMWTRNLGEFRWTEHGDVSRAQRCVYDWTPFFALDSGDWLLEKSPPNSVRSRWLQQNFPSSHFITMVRSPYAVAEGIRRRTGASIEEAAQHWETANRILLSDLPHLRAVIRVGYEEFCATPFECLDQVRSFLGLRTPFQRDSVTELKVHNIEDRVGGIQNFNSSSLKRLTEEDLRAVERIAGPLMEEFGYPRLASPVHDP